MPTWTSNIPSQVKTYANLSAFPATGSVKTIYIAEDTDIAYYWTGSAYQAISIQDLSGLQTIPIVVNANITAQNDRVYHVIANATFTDPTPVEGRGYFVVVRLASSCVLGGNSYIAGETIHRIFHSGSWLNIALRPSTYVPISRTINGLNLSVDRTLTTANINDSTNRRYVTDAQSTVIGNTSGTNTGDETQSSILSKLGWFFYNRVSESTPVTGTTTETIIENIEVSANTYVNGGIMRVYNLKARKVGANGIFTLRLYLNTTSNSLTGAKLIGTFATTGGAPQYIEGLRTYTCTTSGIVGINATSNFNTDIQGQTTAVRLSETINWTVNQYFIVTVQLANSGDSVSLLGCSIKNF